jgi:hypothetical protein
MSHKHFQQSKWPDVLARFMAASGDCKTQAALAKHSGVAQSTIGRILRDEVCPQEGHDVLFGGGVGNAPQDPRRCSC